MNSIYACAIIFVSYWSMDLVAAPRMSCVLTWPRDLQANPGVLGGFHKRWDLKLLYFKVQSTKTNDNPGITIFDYFKFLTHFWSKNSWKFTCPEGTIGLLSGRRLPLFWGWAYQSHVNWGLKTTFNCYIRLQLPPVLPAVKLGNI